MSRLNVPRCAAVTFVVLVAAIIGLNVTALDRQRSSTTVVAVAGRQQVLAEQYLQEILLRQRGQQADPEATMHQLASEQQALLVGGPVVASQGSPDDQITIRGASNLRVHEKLIGEAALVRRLHTQGNAFLELSAHDPRASRQLLQLRITTALLWSTTRDVVGEMTRQANASVDHLVQLEIILGAVAIAAALGMGALFGRSAKRGAAARFRSLVSHASDLVMTTDGEGTITYASPSATPILGYRLQDLVGTAAAELIHPDDLALLTTRVTAVMDQPGGSTIATCRTRHHDGHWLDIESTYTNLLSDPTVRGIVVNGRDITERKQLVDELEHQAFHDNLTGLANRALIHDRLDHALARARRSAATVTLLFCDLDGFKMINDSLGHAAGNEVLIDVARRLERSVRDSDTVARLGGDEFAILLDESAPHDGTLIADRILNALRAPFTIDNREVHVRTSIGIADNSTDALDADELLVQADIAMYAAKARGRDRAEHFDIAMQSELMTRHEILGDLHRALAHNELEVHYQPLVDLTTRRVESLEALLRWNHPTRGLIPPDVFIPIAEETGLIIPIGRYVLHQACQQLAQWHHDFPDRHDLSIGVNVASAQLHDPDFVTDVELILTETGLPGTHLIIELTESTLLSDIVLVQQQLQGLKQHGIQIAIDDFGTGYSSLAYLRAFPVDYLKIDRSFVNELNQPNNTDGLVMVQAIIGIGHNLNLRVVAEGIEQTSQLNELHAANCNTGQGYLFARPAPPHTITTLLAATMTTPNPTPPHHSDSVLETSSEHGP